jgi:hypothetical protein
MSAIPPFGSAVRPSSADLLDVVATSALPSLVLDLVTAHELMGQLQVADVRRSGHWLFQPNVWQRFDRPWLGPDQPGDARLLGSIYVTHGAPTVYAMTINRVTVTPAGAATGWDTDRVLAEALGLVGLTARDCGSIA